MFEEHLQRLDQVLSHFPRHGLKVKPQKCHLFHTQIEYLGQVVSAKGVRPSREKISAVQDWPTQKTVKVVRAFLGLTGYYRQSVKNFTRIMNPLLELLKGVPSHAKNRTIPWGERQEKAFQALKVALTEAPVLAYGDFSQPFILHTDGSLHGLGAVLS
ncbi:uncharacterized protein LOC143767906 [Ranitomeya variabilis]|uniref:uncharacterized protein LOC143767906 n=1 Tax=Ranitomeya variabilis TaxID=490064 RepID=UPI0040566514